MNQGNRIDATYPDSALNIEYRGLSNGALTPMYPWMLALKENIQGKKLLNIDNFEIHLHLPLCRTTEYLVASTDARPYLVILGLRMARSIKVGLEKRVTPLIIVSKTLQNNTYQRGE